MALETAEVGSLYGSSTLLLGADWLVAIEVIMGQQFQYCLIDEYHC